MKGHDPSLQNSHRTRDDHVVSLIGVTPDVLDDDAFSSLINRRDGAVVLNDGFDMLGKVVLHEISPSIVNEEMIGFPILAVLVKLSIVPAVAWNGGVSDRFHTIQLYLRVVDNLA